MAEYINKAELMEQYPEFDGYTFADVTTIDIVHCYKCKHYEKYTEHTGLCNHFVVNGERLAMEYDWFCADGERRKENE